MSPNHCPKREWLHGVLLALVCSLFFLVIDDVPFYDKGEPREALVVRDIVVNGRWLFPLREGEVIPSKPPLFHWTAAGISIARGAMTEAAIRFPSALFASAVVFLVYYLGRRLYGPETGFFAALMLATTSVFQSAAIEARVDMTLTFFVAACLILFFSIYSGYLRHPAWTYLFFAAAGLGVLAKGPVSVILCGLVVIAFLAVRRRGDMLLCLLKHPGVLAGAAIFLSWYGAALWFGGSEFGLQFVKENVARFFVYGDGGTGHQKPVFYFVPYLFTLGMPWTLFLPLVAWRWFATPQESRDGTLFLGLWVAIVFAFFSLSAGKRPPYILPLYPALALLTGSSLLALEREVSGKARVYLKAMAWLSVAIAAVLSAAATVYASGLTAADMLELLRVSLGAENRQEIQAAEGGMLSLGWRLPLFLALAAVLWLAIARDLMRGRLRAVVGLGALFSLLSLWFVHALVAPGYARTRTYKEFVTTVISSVSDQGSVPVYTHDLEDGSLFFYGAGHLEPIRGDYARVVERLGQPPFCMILSERHWQRVRRQVPPGSAVVLRSEGAGPDGEDPLVLVASGAPACMAQP